MVSSSPAYHFIVDALIEMTQTKLICKLQIIRMRSGNKKQAVFYLLLVNRLALMSIMKTRADHIVMHILIMEKLKFVLVLVF